MCRGYIRRPKAIKQKTKLEGYQCGQHERKGEHENRNKKIRCLLINNVNKGQEAFITVGCVLNTHLKSVIK